VKKPNQMDSRNRDAKEILADLEAMGREPCRLVVSGSRALDPEQMADALTEQWSSIVELVGFRPARVVTGCLPVGAEKAARLAAKRVTGKLAVVFHRPDMVHSATAAEMLMNILLSKSGDAALILATNSKPACTNLRRQFAGWDKRVYQVEVK